MTEMIISQGETYLICILLGVVFGALFGLGKDIRSVFKVKKSLIIIWDIIYSVMLSGSVVMVNLFCNQGQVRLYVFFGFFSGFFVFLATIHRVLSMFSIYILCFVRNALKKVRLSIKYYVDIIWSKR